ncbi:MAG: sigma-54 dependent transcriptional regulator [Sedimentibacter sp.]|uniref:sigma-54-dependent transcriptional regulator n=1 Tax=Sedimentibacter sp. TaxID=1960295 RepID=UPI002982A5B9|nr:sigma-54 dependent transcriptional regulator [Sedimentibacter sp.]MDW5299113.1 sigma-54 dependent transcriptional regulator [Sedimentibacter sp.]
MFIIEEINILIIKDEKSYIQKLEEVLSKITKNISVCADFDTAIEKFLNERFDYVITDYNLFDESFTIKNFTESYPQTDLIIAATNPSYLDGSIALNQGALEYIDFNKEDISLPMKLLDYSEDKKDRKKLKDDLFNNYCLNSKNDTFLKVLSHCEKVAKSKSNILLIGEPGTGKEILAKYIHICSPRISNKFISLQCSSYTELMLETDLFGKEMEGKFELANNGTLFLDEIGNISIETQTKLLRVLDTKKVSRINSDKERIIDCKLISSTSKDLYTEVMNGSYREDFFFRINSIVIKVPPLRDRAEDLEQLINYFLKKSQDENGIIINSIDSEAKDFLYTYDYSGNIRELKAIIDRMVVLSVDGRITRDGIPILFNIRKEINVPKVENYKSIISFKDYKKESEAQYLKWVLEQTGGNVTEAARRLNMSSRQLFNKIKEYDINKTIKKTP